MNEVGRVFKPAGNNLKSLAEVVELVDTPS